MLLSYGERNSDDYFLFYGFVPDSEAAPSGDTAQLFASLSDAADWLRGSGLEPGVSDGEVSHWGGGAGEGRSELLGSSGGEPSELSSAGEGAAELGDERSSGLQGLGLLRDGAIAEIEAEVALEQLSAGGSDEDAELCRVLAAGGAAGVVEGSFERGDDGGGRADEGPGVSEELVTGAGGTVSSALMALFESRLGGFAAAEAAVRARESHTHTRIHTASAYGACVAQLGRSPSSVSVHDCPH